MKAFDQALLRFSSCCRRAADWKHSFAGAAYRTRLDAAFKLVRDAYEMACEVDDAELGRDPSPSPAPQERT